MGGDPRGPGRSELQERSPANHCQRGHATGPFEAAEPEIQEYGQEVQARKRMAGKWGGEEREMNREEGRKNGREVKGKRREGVREKGWERKGGKKRKEMGGEGNGRRGERREGSVGEGREGNGESGVWVDSQDVPTCTDLAKGTMEFKGRLRGLLRKH